MGYKHELLALSVKIWDLRKTDVLYTLRGHADTVTGLRLSPDGSYLLSNAMDNSGWGLHCTREIY